MGGEQEIQSLDRELVKLQKSTRTTVPALLPLHDLLRQKYRWYYNWHLWRPAKYFHALFLIVFLLGIGGIFYQTLLGGPKAVMATETVISPTGAGEATEFVNVTGCVNHYDCVKDADENTTIDADADPFDTMTDLFAAGDVSLGGEVIDSVTVTIRARSASGTYRATGHPVIKTGGTIYEGTGGAPGPTFENISYTWTINPKTGVAWTEADVNALQIGARADTSSSPPHYLFVTQVYATVASHVLVAPTVLTVTPTPIAATAITFQGNVTDQGEAPLTGRGFTYWSGASCGGLGSTNRALSAPHPIGAYYYAESPLSVNTQYSYLAYATNGNTGSGSCLTQYTLANVPDAAPTVNTPAQTTLNVMMNDTQPGNNPATTKYAINETTTNQFIQSGTHTLGASADWQLKTTWGTQTVTGLDCGTTYTFKVQARNGDSTQTAYSGTASGTTSACANPPNPPTLPYINGVTTSVMVLNWTDASDNEADFHIERSTDGVNFSGDWTAGADETSYSGTGTTDLSEGTRYWFRVRAHNASGYSAYATTQAITKTTHLLPATEATPGAKTFRLLANETKLAGEDGETATLTAAGANSTYFDAGNNKLFTAENSTDGRFEGVPASTTLGQPVPGSAARIEESRQNKLTYSTFEASGSYNQTNWNAESGLTASSSGTAVHGSYGSNLANGAADKRYYQAQTLTAATYAISAYVQKSGGGAVSATQVQLYAATDLVSAGLTTTYTQVGSTDWYRLTATFTGTAASWNLGFYVKASQTIIVDAAQVEAGAFVTSYIPTTTAAATRNVESFNYSVTNNIDRTVGTISAWIKPSSDMTSATNFHVFRSDVASPWQYIMFGINSGQLRLWWWNSSAGGSAVSSGLTWTANQWYHVAATWNTSTNTTKVYRNGSQVGSGSTGNWPTAIGTTFNIGSYSTGANSFNGPISDFTIFSTALSADQANGLYYQNGPTDVTMDTPTNDGANGGLTVHWSDNSSNETNFTLQRAQTGTCSGGGYGNDTTASANDTSKVITGLSSNTQYCYQLKATLSSHNSPYSQSSAAKYSGIEPPGSITFSNITTVNIGIAPTTTTFTNNGVGSSTVKLCRDGQDPSPVSCTTGDTTNPVDAVDFGGLSINTPYSFTITSYNGDAEANTSPATGSKYTLANTPSPPTLYTITENSMTAVVNANSNPNGTQYETTYDDDPNFGSPSTCESWTGHNNQDTISCGSLTANTAYYFRLSSRNGDSTVSSPQYSSIRYAAPRATKLTPNASIFGDLATNAMRLQATSSDLRNDESDTATFTRADANATFTDDNGKLVTVLNSGDPRVEKVATTDISQNPGRAVRIEEARTNLVLNSSFENRTGNDFDNWNEYVVSSSTVNAETSTVMHSATSVRFDTDASGNQANVYTPAITVSPSTTYTLTFYTQQTGSSCNTAYKVQDLVQSLWLRNDGSWAGDNTFYASHTSSWQRISKTFTTGAGQSDLRVHIGRGTNCASQSTYLDAVQVGAGAFATSYIPTTTAAVTRAAETLTYPASNNITAAAGTISLWVKPNFAYNSSSGSNYFFQAGNVVRLYYNGSDDKFYFEVYNGSNWTTVQATSAAQTFSANTWIHLAATWSTTAGAQLFVNNTKTTDTSTFSAQSLPTNMNVGSDSTPANYANSLISDLTIFNTALTDAQVTAVYGGYAPTIGAIAPVIDAGKNMTVAFTDNSGNEDDFKVERATNTTCAGASYSQIDTPTSSPYTDSDPAKSYNTAYCFQIRGYISTYNSSYSQATTTKYSNIEAPTNITFSTPTTSSLPMTSDLVGAYTNLTTPSSGLIFTNISGGGHTSSKVTTDSYTDSSLSVDRQYCYSVKSYNADNAASTTAGQPNDSPGACKYTLANTPSTPTVNYTNASTSLGVVIAQNGNPTGPAPSDDTNYAWGQDNDQNGSVDANKWLGADGVADEAAEVWQTYSVWGGASGIANTLLTGNNQYCYIAKAKNGDGTPSSPVFSSPAGCKTTPIAYTWSNGAGTGIWLTGANWIDNSAPGPGNTATFSNLSTANSSIDANFGGTIGALNITSGYSGTISAAKDLSISIDSGGTGNYTQAGGTFAPGNQTINVGGNWAYTGGTFTKGTSTINFNAGTIDKTILSGGQHFNIVTFNNAAGGWTFSDAANVDGDFTITAANSVTFGAFTHTILGNTTLAGTTVTMTNSTLNVSGNVTLGGTTLTTTGSTLVMNGTTKNLVGAGKTLNNLTISGTITVAMSDVTVGGTLIIDNTKSFTIDSGRTLTQNGATATVTGTLAVNGTFTPVAGTTVGGTGTLNGSGTAKVTKTGADAFSSQYTVTNKTLTNLTVQYAGAGAQTVSYSGITYGHLEINMSGQTATLGGTTTVGGNLTITVGTLAGSDKTLNVAGNFTKSGGFTANTSTVNLTGATGSTQILSGDTTFNNLAATATDIRTIKFTDGTTTTVSGTWTVTGADASHHLILTGTSTAGWAINPSADPSTTDVSYVTASYSTNSGTKFCAEYSTDGNNNIAWYFSDGTSCAPGEVTTVLLTPDSISQLTLTYTNASNETGYKVWFKAIPTTACSAADYTGADYRTPPADDTTEVYETLSTNTRYCAKVVAYNAFSESDPNYDGKYTWIEAVSSITFSDIQTTTITIAPANTPTGLDRGQSGIQLKNTTNNTCQDGAACTAFQQNTNAWQSSELSVDNIYGFSIQSRNGDSVTTTAATGDKYTLANQPSAPTVDMVSTTSLKVTINQNSNPTGPAPADDTRYAIGIDNDQNGSIDTNGWLKADGTLGNADEVYQTYSTWGGASGITNTLLTEHFEYCYRTKAINGDDAETSPILSAATCQFTPTSPDLATPTITNNNTQTSVTFNGNITDTGHANATERGFKLYTTVDCPGDPVQNPHDTGSYGTGAFTKTNTTVLTAGKVYYYTSYAINPYANNTSTCETFTTPTIPSATVQAADPVSSVAATLNGNITATGIGSPASGVIVTERGFRVYDSSDEGGNTCSSTIRQNPHENDYITGYSAGAFSFATSGELTADHDYYYTAYAINSSSETPGVSSCQLFHTINTTIIMSVQPATLVDEDSATLNGTIVSIEAGDHTHKRGFKFYENSGGCGGTPTDISETGTYGTGAYDLSAGVLSPNVSYSYKSYAVNTADTEEFSPTCESTGTYPGGDKPFVTLAAEPGVSAVPGSWDDTGNPVSVTIDTSGNPAVTEYWVQTKEIAAADPAPQDSCDSDLNWVDPSGWATHTVPFTDYRTADIYACYRVKAHNLNSTETSYSDSSDYKMTAPAKPTISDSLNTYAPAADITQGKIVWNWDPNAVSNSGYKVYRQGTDALVCTTPDGVGTRTCDDDTGLSVNTSYGVYIKAYRSDIYGQPTDPESAYTAIELVSGVTWGTFTTTSLSATPPNTPSNLALGSSGIRYCNTTKGTCSDDWEKVDPPDGWESTGLDINTQYIFTIQSCNGDSRTTTAAQAQKYTKIEAPTGITAVADNPSQISLVATGTLSHLDIGSSGLQFGEIQGNPGSGGQACFTGWTHDNSCVDTGLSANNLYRYEATARNGDGDPSDTYSFQQRYTLIETPTNITTGLITPNSIVLNVPGTYTRLDAEAPDPSGLCFSVVQGGDKGGGGGTGFTPCAKTTTVTDVGLYHGSNFSYTVFAQNSEGVSTPTTAEIGPFPTTIGSELIFRLPGQNAYNQGSNIGGTPTHRKAGEAFNVEMYAVDGSYYQDANEDHLVDVSSDAASYTIDDPTLVDGAINYNVTVNTIGTWHLDGLGSSGSSLEFIVDHGTCSASVSTATASPTSLDVNQTSTVTITLKDGVGNALSGHDVGVGTDQGAGDTIVAPAATNGSGVTTATITGNSAHTSTVTVIDNTDAITLNNHPQITFNAVVPPTPLPSSPSPIIPSPSPVISPVTSPSTPGPGESPTGDKEPPTAPTNLRAIDIGAITLDLAWDASTDNVGVTGYELYNADTNILIGTTTLTTYSLTGLTPNSTYRFRVRAYDGAGNKSGFSDTLTITTRPPVTDEEKRIEEEGGEVAYLVMGNLPDEINAGQPFPNKVRVVVADAGGRIVNGYTKAVYFDSTDSQAKFLYDKKNPYTFTELDAGIHEFGGAGFILRTTGRQKVTVSDYSTTASAEVKVLSALGLPTVFQKATNKVQDFFAKPENVAKVNTGVVTTTAAILLTPFLINTGLALSTLWPQIIYWLTQLLQVLGIRRRRKPWGVIFNSQTGQPISLAMVRIIDKKYNRILEQSVTDNQGRYGFLAKEGSFYLTVTKAGFIFPSKEKTSSFYERIYAGGEFKIAGSKQTVSFNIPLDPHIRASLAISFWIILVKVNRFLQKLRLPLLVIGVIFAMVMIIISYDILFVLSLIFYLLIGVLEYFRTRKARPFGVVSDVFNHPLELTIVRIYDKRTNRLIETDVTDRDGRFKFLVAPGIYYLSATKPGYIDFKSHLMYLEKEKTLVSTNIKMKKEEK